MEGEVLEMRGEKRGGFGMLEVEGGGGDDDDEVMIFLYLITRRLSQAFHDSSSPSLRRALSLRLVVACLTHLRCLLLCFSIISRA